MTSDDIKRLIEDERTLIRVRPNGNEIDSNGVSSAGEALRTALTDKRGWKSRLNDGIAAERKIPYLIASISIFAAIATVKIGSAWAAQLTGIGGLSEQFVVAGLGTVAVLSVGIAQHRTPALATHSLNAYLIGNGSDVSVVCSAGERTQAVADCLRDAYGAAAEVTVVKRTSIARLCDVDAASFVSADVGKVYADETRALDALTKGDRAADRIADSEATLPLAGLLPRMSRINEPIIVEITVTPRYGDQGRIKERIGRLDNGSDMTLRHQVRGLIADWMSAAESLERENLPRSFSHRAELLEAKAETKDETNNKTNLLEVNIRYIGPKSNIHITNPFSAALNRYITLHAAVAPLPSQTNSRKRSVAIKHRLIPGRNDPQRTLKQLAAGAPAWTSPTNVGSLTAVAVHRENLTVDDEEIMNYLLIPGNNNEINNAMAVRPPSQRPGRGPGKGRIDPLKGDDW